MFALTNKLVTIETDKFLCKRSVVKVSYTASQVFFCAIPNIFGPSSRIQWIYQIYTGFIGYTGYITDLMDLMESY